MGTTPGNANESLGTPESSPSRVTRAVARWRSSCWSGGATLKKRKSKWLVSGMESGPSPEITAAFPNAARVADQGASGPTRTTSAPALGALRRYPDRRGCTEGCAATA